MKVIFLDIDGVLNSSELCEEYYKKTGKNGYGGFFDEEDVVTHDNVLWGQKLVDRLQHIVKETGAKIVISSTWRKHFTVPKFKEMFDLYNFEAPVIDRTAYLGSRSRGFEINQWIEKHKPENYVILDDYPDFLPDQQSHYVETNPDIGLTQEDAEKAITILNKSHGTIQEDKVS